MKQTKRPNLLFILTDEQRPDTLGCYGNDFVQAPHLNGLAKRSFVFKNAYCTQPLFAHLRALRSKPAYGRIRTVV